MEPNRDDVADERPLDDEAERQIQLDIDCEFALPTSLPTWVVLLIRFGGPVLIEIIKYLMSIATKQELGEAWVQSELAVAASDLNRYYETKVAPAIESSRRRRRRIWRTNHET